MRSLKQSEASRINGARSRGPVSAEGKARSAANSTKHGLYCQTVVLENEDEELYGQWLDGFLAAWQPADDHEYTLVMDIVDARWRLRRYSVLETKALDFEIGRLQPELDEAFEELDEGTRTVFGLTSLITLNRSFEVIQTVLRAQHRVIERASRQLMDRRKRRGESPVPASFAAHQPTASEISENEPEPAQPAAPRPEPSGTTDTPRGGSRPPSGASKPGPIPMPQFWRNEPEPALSPEAEAAMEQLFDSFLREKLGPDALAKPQR